MYSYPVNLEPDDNDTVVVNFPDLPEAVTFGDDEEVSVRSGRGMGPVKVSVRSGRGMGPVKRISHVEARPHKVLSFCW